VNTKKVFKSDEGRDKIRAYYNQVLSFFAFKQQYISTTYGNTFLLEAGEGKNPVVVLLHGSCSNSAFWVAEMTELSKNFHVFAVDIIGEAGNSDEVRLELSTDAYAFWIKEILDTLEIDKVILIGNSLGGWMALKFAAAFSERISKLILIAPSGIVPPREEFIEKSVNAISKGEQELKRLHDDVNGQSALPKEVMDFIVLILENFNPITGALPVYTDDQMRRLKMPVLYIAGKEDTTVDRKNRLKGSFHLYPVRESS
jgi:pimeloyl-ACP methyl ester carboxylesterase